MTLEVIYVDKPVFILELREPADLKSPSARQVAETQIMQYMAYVVSLKSSLTFMDSL